MAIKNTSLGGTDWAVKNPVTHTDLNDTFDAVAALILTGNSYYPLGFFIQNISAASTTNTSYTTLQTIDLISSGINMSSSLVEVNILFDHSDTGAVNSRILITDIDDGTVAYLTTATGTDSLPFTMLGFINSPKKIKKIEVQGNTSGSSASISILVPDTNGATECLLEGSYLKIYYTGVY